MQFQEESQLIEDLAFFNSFTSALRADDRIERIRMSAPTISMFSTLGATPVLGRLPTPEDEDGVFVISHKLWTTWFGADPEVIGRTYYVSGEDRTVIGVMGPDFWFPTDGTLLWFPQIIRPEEIEPGRFGQPLVARLAPGARLETVAAELEGLAKRLPERFGGSANYRRVIEQFRTVVRPLEERLLGPVSGPIWILLGSVAIVLLIAYANVANLFMVRAERRLPDLAVRRALGATRGRLILSQLAEATVVAALAGALAVVLARVGMPLLLAAAPANVPRLEKVTLTPTRLLFTFGACVLCALLCGLVPAVSSSSPSLARLHEGGRGSTVGRHWGQHALVAAQTARALVLLIGSALLLRSFDKLRNVDPGYDTEDIFTFQIAPEGEHLQDAPSYARFHTDFMERVAGLPGVERLGIVENVPLNQGVATRRFFTEEMAGEEEGGTLLSFTWSAGDYFRTMNIEVFQGRVFTPADNTSQLGNILVSRSAAEQLWPGEDPIGKRLQMQDQEVWETVVGVVDDVLQYGFRQAAEPMVYYPPGRAGPREQPGGLVPRLRRQDRPGRRDRPRDPRPGAPGRAHRSDVPHVHHGRPGRRLDGPALLHHADDRHRLGAGADHGGGRPLRRAVLRGRRAHPRDRPADGPGSGGVPGAADGGRPGGAGAGGRHRGRGDGRLRSDPRPGRPVVRRRGLRRRHLPGGVPVDAAGRAGGGLPAGAAGVERRSHGVAAQRIAPERERDRRRSRGAAAGIESNARRCA